MNCEPLRSPAPCLPNGSKGLRGRVEPRRAIYPGHNEVKVCAASVAGFLRGGKFTFVTLDDARFGQEKFIAAATAR